MSNAVGYNENGDALATNVWTGTLADGSLMPNRHFGFSNTNSTAYGESGVTSSNWVNLSVAPNSLFFSLYGLSSAVVVSAVPIPAAVWLFGSGLLGLISVARRKKT